MTERNLPDMPARIARLPRDRGYPVPWFVAWIDGKPEFRVIAPGRIHEAYFSDRCWTCGGSLGRHRAYVVGPMCAVNRTSAEPPSHRDCAIFAATACPFLTRPHARRREADMPEGLEKPAGIALLRNPGVALVWVTVGTFLKPAEGVRGRFRARPKRAEQMPHKVLFDLRTPVEALWFAHGRPATRAEVDASIESGFPALHNLAVAEGPVAIAELDRLVERVQPYLPVAR